MDILELLGNLEDKQLDYVVERAKCTRDVDAYTAIGVSKSAFYKWEAREELNNLAQRLKRENATQAMLVLQGAAQKAADVLVEQLELKRSPTVRQKAAIEVLNRVTGTPTQKVEQKNSGSMTIRVEYAKDD